MTPIEKILDIIDMLDSVGFYTEADELHALMVKEAGIDVDVDKFVNILRSELSGSLGPQQLDLVEHWARKSIEKAKPEMKPHRPVPQAPKTYKIHPITLAENIATLWDDKLNIESEIKLLDNSIKTTKDPAQIKTLHDKMRRLEMELVDYKKDLDRNNMHVKILQRDYPEEYAKFLAAKKSISDEKRRMHSGKPRGERSYHKDYSGYEGLRRMEEESIEV